MGYKQRRNVDMSELPVDKQKSRGYDYCIWHLSQTNRTEKYLRDKMRGKKYIQSVIDEVMDSLKESGYLDDNRFAENYMERSDVQKMGKRAISYKLRNEGIDGEKIESLLSEISEEDERESARELVQKKLSSMSDDLPLEKKRNRLFGLLSRKGFSGDIVFSVVRECLDDE